MLAQEAPEEGGASLDLGVSGIGLSLGSAPRWTGLRINASDRRLERIDGVNLTLWKPGDAVGGAVNGVALGLVAPRAGRLRGLSIGVLGVLPERGAVGIAVGGLGVVSEGGLAGIGAALLGVVTEEPIGGLALAGLGVVTEGGARGLHLAGLGVVSEGPLTGVGVAGLGVVAERPISGIHLAGLGLVSEADVRGLGVAGLAVVAGSAVEGVAAALLKVDTHALSGVGIAAWNRVWGTQRGLTIGLFNQAETLHGVQLGLLNYAGNNPRLTRWTPLLNLHLD